MNLQLGINRQFRKLGVLLSIPATILISMLVIRFINQSGPVRVNAPGALMPNNKIELQSKTQNSISQLTGELEQEQESERLGHKLVSLDFPSDIVNASKSFTHSTSVLTHSGLSNIDNRTSDSHKSPLSESADTETSELFKSKLRRRQALYPALSSRSHLQKGNTGLGAKNSFREEQFSSSVVSPGKKADLIQQTNSINEQKTTVGAAGFNGFSKADSRNNPGIFTDGVKEAHTSQMNFNMQIKAFALGDQKIHQGSIVKFRTMSEYAFNGQRILQNTIFYAFASFENDRLKLYVNKIKASSLSFNLHLVCFDEDEKEGIAINTSRNKWAETAETGKNSAVDEVSSRLPVASGILSQVGHKLFSASKNEEFLLADGLELSFKQRTD